MSDLDEYTDAEIIQMVREASRQRGFYEKEKVTTRQAIKAFLRMIGLGFIADAIEVAEYVWERIQNLWRSIFG